MPKKKIPERKIGTISAMIGDTIAENAHAAASESLFGMSAFLQKAAQLRKVDFDFSKGNYFEYIEATKFNQQAALARNSVRAVVTDAAGDPHAAADIRIVRDGVTLREVQAKFSKTASNGVDTSAATSVAEQAGIKGHHVGKYDGMDRLIRKEVDYKDGHSLLDESRRLAQSRADAGGIYADEYHDVAEHLTDELHHDDIHSGGTTYEEVQAAHRNPDQYAREMVDQQFRADTLATMGNMAAVGAAMSAVATGVQGFVLVYQDQKTLGEALKDTGVAAVKGAARGGFIGWLSSVLRHVGIRRSIPLLSNSNAATILASGILDCGSFVYAYARGQISEKEMAEGILNTTAKGAATVYFTNFATKALGIANPCIPMAIYTAFSFIASATKTIITNASLQAEEYRRVTMLYEEATALQAAYQQQILANIDRYEQRIRRDMRKLITSFAYDIDTGKNYDNALRSLTTFAKSMGIVLQYADYSDFEAAMVNGSTFRLE